MPKTGDILLRKSGDCYLLITIINKIEKELNIKLNNLHHFDLVEHGAILGYFLNEQSKVIGLNLFSSQIKNLKRISSLLEGLKSLINLNLCLNFIKDISPLKELKQLTILNLMNNRISDISILKEFKNLKSLILINNEISDISMLKGLKELTYLDLSGNYITELPNWITDFDMDIILEEVVYSGLNLNENEIITPPIEVLEKGKEAIKNFFEQKKT